MSILFWITLIILLVQYTNKFFLKKDYFNISTYIITGVYFPLILYFFNWSSLIDSKVSDEFYSIFIYLNLFIILSSLLDKTTLNDYYYEFSLKKKFFYVKILNLGYIFCSLLENYIGSGYFFPAIHLIDIHTFSAKGLSYFTNSLFILFFVNYIYFYKSKNRKYILWIIVLAILPLVGKSSRMQVVLSSFQLLSFILFIYINDKKHKKKEIRKLGKKRNLVYLFVLGVIFLSFLLRMTEYRWSSYGKYQVSYENSIGYTGPDIFSNFISIYYGYFPISFNNLNINIKNRNISHNYMGLYTFKALNFGIFRLHNIFGLDPYQPRIGGLVTSGIATVPTGFFDFYYDYGVFSFIPILISALFYNYLKRKVGRHNKNIFFLVVYFYWVPLWFFMSFQNVVYSSLIITNIIIMYFISNYFIELNRIE